MSRSDLSAIAAGAALGVLVVVLWNRPAARRPDDGGHDAATVETAPSEALAAPVLSAERPLMMSELERLAGVAVSHGPDDPALDVFLTFVSALDPLPDAATLRPAAWRIGKARLEQALGRQGAPRLGARRLLAAATDEPR